MSKWCIVLVLCLLITGCLLVTQKDRICYALDSYGCQIAEQGFGDKEIKLEHEKWIRSIADEMGVVEPFSIRRMNYKSFARFGYYNAFVCFPSFAGIIPIGNKPFLFVSDGFLEDLSLEEQRFLIGHEMVHVREHHLQYLNLVIWIFRLFLLIVFGLGYQYFCTRYLLEGNLLVWSILLFLCFIVPGIISLAYMRSIEREADRQALITLNAYEGCFKLIERWEKEYQVPAVNPFYGLLADHPSSVERKLHCEYVQNKAKGY